MDIRAGEYTRDFNIGSLPGDEVMARTPGGSKKGVIPVFFTMPRKNEKKSAERGIAVHDEVEMVQLIMPGDRNSVCERKVTEFHKQLYAKEYDRFKKGLDMVVDGTRLEDWPILSRAQIYDLKAMNLWTVEQVANLSDAQIMNVGIGGRQLRNHAKAFLETAKTGQVPAQLVAQNEQLANQVLLLTDQLSKVTRQLGELMKKSGQNPADAPDPLLEVKLAAQQAAGVSSEVVIPDNVQALGLAELNKIISEFSSVRARNKNEALEMIADYRTKKSALAA